MKDSKSLISKDRLIYVAYGIERYIQIKGLERYDPSDILAHPLFKLTASGCLRPLWNGLRILELLCPITLRKILRIRKTLAPTTLWHLVQSYLSLFEAGYGTEFNAVDKLRNLCDLAIAIAEDSTHLCWSHPYAIHGSQWRNESFLRCPSFPINCAHNTARLGLALLRVGRCLNMQQLVQAGLSAARSCIAYNNWHWYDNRRICAVSYYPDTDDEVINTGAEVALLLSEAYLSSGDSSFAEHARGLFRMIITEQEVDGGWRYCTRAHEQRYGPSSGPDNHHHAMVISVIANCYIRHNELIGDDIVKKALIRGVNYYIENLSNENGFCFLFCNQKREANIAGYCEGFLALQRAYASLCRIEPTMAQLINKRCGTILKRLLERYLRHHNGRVISDRRFGISYDIDSIRWGSGLMLEAISCALKSRSLS